MFNMDFKSDGMTWVGNIYEKLEAICQEVDGIMIQEKAKYIESQVQTGCDNVRRFCAEVMQDLLLPAACDVKGPVSDLSLVCDADVGMHRKSKVGSPIEEKTLTPAELDVFVSPGKLSSPAPLPNEHNDLNKGEGCVALTKESVRTSEEVSGYDFLEKAEENHIYNTDACLAVSSAPATAAALSPDVTAALGTHKSYEPMKNVQEQQNKLDEFNFVLPSSEIGRSNDFDWEEATMSGDAIEPSIESSEEFEDVTLENCLNLEAEKNEVCLVSVQEQRKRSYKKKLRDVFASKIRSAKRHNHEHLETHSLNGYAEVENCIEISESPMSREGPIKKLLAHDTCDSEWEFL